MKEYRQVPAAVEFSRRQECQSGDSLQIEGYGSQRPPFEQPEPRCGRSAAMVKSRTWVNIVVCPGLHLSLTHIKDINPFENKVCEEYFCKEVYLFVIEVVIIVDYVPACICIFLYA